MCVCVCYVYQKVLFCYKLGFLDIKTKQKPNKTLTYELKVDDAASCEILGRLLH